MRISDWSSDVCSSDLAGLEQFGVDPADVDLHAIGDAAVDERFVERFIGILKADIFADDADRDLALGTLQPLDDLGPARQIGRAAGRAPERLQPLAVAAFRMFLQRPGTTARNGRATGRERMG